jgi:hypothetical protein
MFERGGLFRITEILVFSVHMLIVYSLFAVPFSLVLRPLLDHRAMHLVYDI